MRLLLLSVLVCLSMIFGVAYGQTVLSNNTALSGTIAGNGIGVFEFATVSNQDLRVVVTLLSGSCGANFRDGSTLPLSTSSRFSVNIGVGTTRYTISSCSVGSASKWYFALTNGCTSTAVQYQITVTAVSRQCVVPFSSGNGTDTHSVNSADRWAYYSVPITSPTEIRIYFRHITATSSCSGYSLYTRLDQTPTIDFYDRRTYATNGGDLYLWRSSCEPTGTNLFVGVRIDCEYDLRNTDFFIQMQSIPRPCVVPLLAPFPSQLWTIRPTQFTHYVLPFASSNINKNMSLVMTARALSSSLSTAVQLWNRVGDRPTVDFYDVQSSISSDPQIAYSACELQGLSGDLFVAVSNANTDYYRPLDFQLSFKTQMIACNQLMTPGVVYDGEVGHYWFQRYSIVIGDTPRFIITAGTRSGSPSYYIRFRGRWNSEPDSATYDVGFNDPAPVAVRYDGCDPAGTPRSGTFFIGLQSGSTGYDLQYTSQVYFYDRPCTLAVPPQGLFVTETAVDPNFYFYYSWEAVVGQRLRIEAASSLSIEVRYQFNDRSTSGGTEIFSLPNYITATQTGTYYIRIRSRTTTISATSPRNFTVSMYDETTVQPIRPPARPPVAPPPLGPPADPPARAPSVPKPILGSGNRDKARSWMVTFAFVFVALLWML